MPHSWQSWRHPLSYLAIAAVLAGIYFRFKGLGSAPFAVDEYYLARSIENVLRVGIPAYPCGGFYMRGLALQYMAAALQRSGSAAEWAPRAVGAVASVLALPAIFIIGRRVNGVAVGLLAVTLMAVSVWEIETARFGRMYAPFQALFLWYLVFFLRYTVDRHAKALWPMLLLSIAGPLVWEGGVFLPLLNVLSLFLQRWPDDVRRSDWPYLAGCTLLLMLAVWFVTADFRGYTPDSWPPGYSRTMSASAPDVVATLRLPLRSMLQGIWWMAAVVPLAAALLALRWIWSRRSRPFLVAGLLAMLAAAAAHQFIVVAALGGLLLLTRLTDWQGLFNRQASAFHAALALLLLFWLAYGIAIVDWHAAGPGGLPREVARLAYQFLKVPDVVGVVIRPWARAVPHLGIALLILVGVALYRAASSDEVSPSERVLLVVFLIMLLAASASHPPRQETRYVFFLYPLAIVVALATITRGVSLLSARPAVVAGATAAVALGGFALSEDCQPRHLLRIDSPAETFRLGMTPDMQSHLVIREDFRSLARWLQVHRTSGELVINGVHGFDHYFPDIDYFYVEQQDPNFPDWTCRKGSVDRWSNLPLLSSVAALSSKVDSTSGAYLVAFSYNRDAILDSLAALHASIAAASGDIIIIKLKG